MAKRRDIDPDYFDVMDIPLLAGRRFFGVDTASSDGGAIISRSMASLLFPGEDPLGRLIAPFSNSELEVIGIVGDVRNVRLEAGAEPAFYVPRAQDSSELICLVVRTTAGTPDLAPAVRAIVAPIDSGASS